MKLLYSNVLPICIDNEEKFLINRFDREMADCDKVEIAVGYVSKAALEEIDRLVEEYKIKNIHLTLGMYYIEGMPESIYNTAIIINQKWREEGIGEIRLIKPFKYHGKTYTFYKNGKVKSAIVGSANLGAIKLEANNRRQYEVSVFTDKPEECIELAELIQQLQSSTCSVALNEAKDLQITREENTAISKVNSVLPISSKEVNFYKTREKETSFYLPLKVPSEDQKFSAEKNAYTKSNLNVCYAAPRSARKSRDWYETQLTVSIDITRQPGYPEKNKPFWIVTDDGYRFKAHTTSDHNKQFSAVGDELIMGYWLKGRLEAAGLIKHVPDTQKDIERKGMITKEVLKAYGADTLYFRKTDQQLNDENGESLDVWFLSFETKMD